MTSSILPGPDLALAGQPAPSVAQSIASYTDVGKLVIGREYLGAWYKFWRSTPGGNPIIVVRGDSTIEGLNNVGNAAYKPTAILTTIARSKGFVITAVNAGVSGETIDDWLNTRLPADLITYAGSPPPLYIVHYFMNDHRSTGANLSNAQIIAKLKAGIALLRGTWSAQQTSVLVVGSNTSAWDAVDVNEAWREGFNYQIIQACRDTGVAYFDTYALAREARYGLLTGWLDTTNLVHPNEDFNMLIWGHVADVIFPPGLQAMNSAPTLVTAVTGYGNPGLAGGGAFVAKQGAMVIGNGFITVGTPAPIAVGATIMSIPAGFEPVDQRAYGVQLNAFDGSSGWEYVKAEVRQAASSSNVVLREAITISPQRIYFGPGIWYH